jgi:hypothetical protein
MELERPNRAVRCDKLERGRDLRAQVLEPGPERECGPRGSNRSLEQHVEKHLLRHEVFPIGRRRLADVGERRIEGREGAVGQDRDLRRGNAGRGQPVAVLIQLDEPRNPHRGEIRQPGGQLRNVEIAGGLGRELDIAHRGQRHAHQQLEAIPGSPG